MVHRQLMKVINQNTKSIRKKLLEISFHRRHFKMESQRKLINRVQTVSSIFGVCFAMNLARPIIIVRVIFVQLLFIGFTSSFFESSFSDVKNPIYIALMALQCVVPLVIEVCINIEAFRKRKQEEKFVEIFKDLQLTLVTDLNCNEVRGSTSILILFVLKILVLIFVRLLKLTIADTLYSFNGMMTELICSVSDYAFIFYVDLLKIYVREYINSINSKNIEHLNVRKHYLTFYEISQMITQRFSVSLFCNIAFTFITLITSFYWVFIRIIYGPLRQGLATWNYS